ncbi:hypothetical protein [Aestuariirhabdus sp. LZHN29]|uniref:hypothetical protein n=1 Tax=Aestuariirhabdus sp. LZHN29 TaxID=3417462 RepID=UPI003CF2AAF2
MSTMLYELSFSGELIAGADPVQARKSLGSLFKANESQLDRLFSGQRVIIKNNLELTAGRKYLQALNKAGVQGHLFDMATGREWIDPLAQAPAAEPRPTPVKANFDAPQQPAPTPPPSKASFDAAPSPTGSTARPAQALVGTASAQVEVATPDWDIAAAGTDMQDSYDHNDPDAPDTSHLSLRPMKGNLVDPTPKNDPPPPDTSHLKLEE